MSRNIIAENISEKLENIQKYKLQLQKYIHDNPANEIIESILLKSDELKKASVNPNRINTVEIAMETIKENFMKCKPLYLLFNMLFNKRGRNTDTQYSKDIIELFLESILFDLFMEKTPDNKDTIRKIQDEAKRIVGKTQKISIFKDYVNEYDYGNNLETETKYKTTDAGKYMFHLYIINRVYKLTKIAFDGEFHNARKKNIQEYIQKAYGKNHNISNKDAELIFLIYLAEFISKIYTSNINFYKKVEYLYSLKEYTNSLYSLVYAMIVDFIDDDTYFRNILSTYESSFDSELDIKQQLEKIRRNIKNREKSFKNLSKVDFYLNTVAIFAKDGRISVSKYLNLLLDTVEECGNVKQEKRFRRNFNKINNSAEDFSELYKNFRTFLPENCLFIENHLRKQILYLLKNIDKDMKASEKTDIYSTCFSIYLDITTLFEYLSLFNSKSKIPNHSIWDDMRYELAQVLFSKVKCNGRQIALIDFLQTGYVHFFYWSNYHQTAKFKSVKATGFIPYLQSLIISYNFVDADEAVQLIIDILNQLVDYVRDIIIGLYDGDKELSDETLNSLIYNGIKNHFGGLEINSIQKKLFVQWDTRTSYGCIFPEEIRQLLIEKKNLIKEIL